MCLFRVYVSQMNQVCVFMYANAAGIVPVIEVFVAKGVPIGTALAFMMAVVGLSLPEATLLKKVMTCLFDRRTVFVRRL